MNAPLPTAKELEKLPMRAVVAYASRTAHRISSEFRGIISDDILDDALRVIDSVSMPHRLGEVDAASVIRANERVIAAYVTAPLSMKSEEKFRMLFSLVHAALAAMNALLAAANPSITSRQMERVADAAQRAVRPLECLNGEAAIEAKKAARRDYDILLWKYGEHDGVIIGDPVDCFDDE